MAMDKGTGTNAGSSGRAGTVNSDPSQASQAPQAGPNQSMGQSQAAAKNANPSANPAQVQTGAQTGAKSGAHQGTANATNGAKSGSHSYNLGAKAGFHGANNTAGVGKAGTSASKGVGNVAGAGSASHGAGSGAGGLKGSIGGAVSAVQGAVTGVASSAIHGLAHFFQGMFSALTQMFSSLGATTTIATVLSATLLAAPALAIGTGTMMMANQAQLISTEQTKDSCAKSVKKQVSNVKSSNADIEKQQRFKKAYAILHEYGFSDTQIAGIFGNWQNESSINPKRLEADMYLIGDGCRWADHDSAINDIDAYTQGVFDCTHKQLNYAAYYDATSGRKICGIGFGQWTGPRGGNLLRAAEATGQKWDSLEFQLSFMLASGDSGSTLEEYKQYQGSSTDCAAWFRSRWEGGAVGGEGWSNTINFASEWDHRLVAENWAGSADRTYAQGVLASASKMGTVSTTKAAQANLSTCKKDASELDKSDLAGIDLTTAEPGSLAAVLNWASLKTASMGPGMCAAWVTKVFQNAGVSSACGDACDMYYKWCTSNNRDELKPGMIIATPSLGGSADALRYGHIGIYVGNGKVWQSLSGVVKESNLDDFLDMMNAVSEARWGWFDGKVLVP